MHAVKSEKVLEKIIAPALTAMYSGMEHSKVTEDVNGKIDASGLKLPADVRAECVCNGTPAEFMSEPVVSKFRDQPVAAPRIVLPHGLDAVNNLKQAVQTLYTRECDCSTNLLACDLPALRDLKSELEGSINGNLSSGVMLSGDVARCRTLAYEICKSQMHGGSFHHVYHVLTVKDLDERKKQLKDASDEPMLVWVDVRAIESELSSSEVRRREIEGKSALDMKCHKSRAILWARPSRRTKSLRWTRYHMMTLRSVWVS